MTLLLTNSSRAGSISQLITVILIFVLVLIVTVYATKYVGSYQKMQGFDRNLEVIETMRLTNNKYLQIVRAADKYIVIAIGKDEVTMLTEIDGDELISVSSDKGSMKDSFAEILSKSGIKFPGKNEAGSDKSNNNE